MAKGRSWLPRSVGGSKGHHQFEKALGAVNQVSMEHVEVLECVMYTLADLDGLWGCCEFLAGEVSAWNGKRHGVELPQDLLPTFD
jgi:hypothetical protein